MTTKITRTIGLFFALMFSSVAGFGQASPRDMYVGSWKGEMNMGRAVPVEFAFEKAGDKLNGFAVDAGGQKAAFSQVIAIDSGIVFRLDRGEGSFMVFAGKLGVDKASLSGSVTVMEGTTERGKAAWTAKKVIAGAASANTGPAATAQPPAAQAAYDRGFPLIRSRAFNAAAAAFTECIAAAPKDLSCLYFRGVALTRIGKFKEAIVDLNNLIQLAPTAAAPALIARGEARIMAGDDAGAIADADAAFKLNGTPDSYIVRGAAFRSEGIDIRMSSLVYDTEAKDKPAAMGWMTKALAEFNKFIELKPQDHRGYQSRGGHYFDLWNAFSDGTRLKDALADLDKALSLSPQNAEVFYSRSLVHGALGNKANATADLAKSNELSKR